jgi:hypothetical protein
MLRGYRGYIAAAVGIGLAIAALGAFALRPVDLPSYQELQGPKANYRPGGTSCDPARLRSIPGGNAPNERIRCEDAAEEYRLKRNDLVQQARSANAAEALVAFTYRQTGLLLVGTILGLLTLGAAAYAAWYAKRAAEAAEKDLAHSLHSARPHLNAEDESVVIDENADPQFVARVVLRNVGGTPAEDLKGFILVMFLYFNGGRVRVRDEGWRNGTTGTDGTAALTFGFSLAPDEMRALKQGKGEICLKLNATFGNRFDEAWKYVHDLVIDQKSLGSGLIYTKNCRQFREPEKKKEGEARHQPRLPMTGA